MTDQLTDLFNRWWDDKGAALAPGDKGEQIRQATESAWRSGCYIQDLPNPCLRPMQELNRRE